jgi:hypothetical protein
MVIYFNKLGCVSLVKQTLSTTGKCLSEPYIKQAKAPPISCKQDSIKYKIISCKIQLTVPQTMNLIYKTKDRNISARLSHKY